MIWMTRKEMENIRIGKKGKKVYEYNPPESVGWRGPNHHNYIMSVWDKLKTDMEINKGEDRYVHAYCGICLDEREKIDYSSILFKKEYWNEVEQILRKERKYIGVHIRRTDHERAIKNSDTDAFIKKMKEILEKVPETVFFLATDDRHEEERLKEIFEDRIVTQKGKVWGRDTVDGMKAGIIDCLCLSSCDYILGSDNSVFSSFSALYSDKQLIICGKDIDSKV